MTSTPSAGTSRNRTSRPAGQLHPLPASHGPDQIIAKLREADVLIARGQTLVEGGKQVGVTGLTVVVGLLGVLLVHKRLDG